VVGRRGVLVLVLVLVLKVRLPAHLLFETERIHVEFRLGVDEVLDDDSRPSIAEFSLKILLDLHGTFQRPAGLVDMGDIVHRAASGS
jgi:hypothetical protein